MLQVRFLKTQIMRWRFACRKVTEASSWDQYFWEGEGSITGQREKVNCDATVRKASHGCSVSSPSELS